MALYHLITLVQDSKNAESITPGKIVKILTQLNPKSVEIKTDILDRLAKKFSYSKQQKEDNELEYYDENNNLKVNLDFQKLLMRDYKLDFDEGNCHDLKKRSVLSKFLEIGGNSEKIG